MEPFQKVVKESLNFFNIYNYHSPDFNIKNSWQSHRFTMPKDADFIIANIFGEIGWIEVKNISGKKFYVNNQDTRQWRRAVALEELYGTFFYVINFKDISKPFWFMPSMIKQRNQFDPQLFPQYEILYSQLKQEGSFRRNYTRRILNLQEAIPFFQRPSKLVLNLKND